MPDELSLDPSSSAVLAMDFQNAIVSGHADKEPLLARTASLIVAARRADVPVIYIVVGFRPGFPEVSPRNKLFSMVKTSGRFAAGGAETAICDAVAPAPDDVVVTKHRVGAFAGTDLEMILRAAGRDTLILAGVATSGVVLSTLRCAADADYRLVVASDCCADGDPEVHRVLTGKVFPRQACVATADAIIAALAV